MPPIAATGKPPPSPLAIVVMSGITPKNSWPPPRANRNPVITSSKISSAPCSRVRSRSNCRKPSSGRMQPVFSITGSVMTAAIWSPSSAITASNDSGSFHDRITSESAISGSMPRPAATGTGR